MRLPLLAGAALYALGTVTLVAQAKATPAKTTLVVYKTPTCGCCGNWVQYMEANGFKATVVDMSDTSTERARRGVPAHLASCHTAVVGRYVIEGHVPAADVKRLLREKPDVVGLSAPGMPAGAPGMDVPNSPPYDVVSFDKQGHRTVFATHR
jgi:hypothetical protein